MTDSKLEMLITRYEAAIHADKFSESRVNQLARLVEARADEINYQDHRRLYVLHTAAEYASERNAKRD